MDIGLEPNLAFEIAIVVFSAVAIAVALAFAALLTRKSCAENAVTQLILESQHEIKADVRKLAAQADEIIKKARPGRLAALETKVKRIDHRIAEIDHRIAEIDHRIAELDTKIKSDESSATS